jgi:hypothetical protein
MTQIKEITKDYFFSGVFLLALFLICVTFYLTTDNYIGTLLGALIGLPFGLYFEMLCLIHFNVFKKVSNNIHIQKATNLSVIKVKTTVYRPWRDSPEYVAYAKFYIDNEGKKEVLYFVPSHKISSSYFKDITQIEAKISNDVILDFSKCS